MNYAEDFVNLTANLKRLRNSTKDKNPEQQRIQNPHKKGEGRRRAKMRRPRPNHRRSKKLAPPYRSKSAKGRPKLTENLSKEVILEIIGATVVSAI